MPIGNLVSPSHPVDVQWVNGSSATVRLKDQQSIPNKDFLLRCCRRQCSRTAPPKAAISP